MVDWLYYLEKIVLFHFHHTRKLLYIYIYILCKENRFARFNFLPEGIHGKIFPFFKLEKDHLKIGRQIVL